LFHGVFGKLLEIQRNERCEAVSSVDFGDDVGYSVNSLVICEDKKELIKTTS